ncbi:MAG: alpha/beta fold hydrolase [Kofleriaceae bacterium]
MPADLTARGPWGVGARTVELDGQHVEIWYPATMENQPRARYDLRAAMPPAEAAKIPDADNAWLDCECSRDVPLDTQHGAYPVVLFLHGAASFRAQSTFLATHWASRGFIVIAPDLPGVGLLAILGGEPTVYPLVWPSTVLDAIVKPRASDPFAPVRARMMAGRVAVVGHSLGAMLAQTLNERAEVVVRIALAGAIASAPGSVLAIAGATDGIAPPSRTPVAGARIAVVAGAGHLAFTDLCGVGADRGGSLAIARAHGVTIPPMIETLAQDGCRPTDAPFAATAPLIRGLTTGVLEETLHCDATRTTAIRELGSRSGLELQQH